MQRSLAAIVIALGLLLAARAEAALYEWSFLSPFATGSGTLTTTDGPSPVTITDITGLFAGDPITGLLPPGSLLNNDNLLYASPPYLDLLGVSFSGESDTYNIYYFDVLGGYRASSGAGQTYGSAEFSLTEIPEPVSLGLLGTGVAGLLAARRRGRA